MFELTADSYYDDIFFFDFDGVIVPHRGDATHVNLPENEFCESVIRANGPIIPYQPCKNIRNFIDRLDCDRVYILGAVRTSFESRTKEKFIKEIFPNFVDDHIIWVSSPKYKVLVVKTLVSMNRDNPKPEFYNIKPRNVVMVDDQFDILKDFEDAGFTALHNSEFL